MGTKSPRSARREAKPESPAHAGAARGGAGNAAAQDRLKDAPYSSVYGKRPKGSAFEVEEGQLTFDAEGTEGGRYHSRKAHVLPGPSGVTIGRGYDLGQHTAKQIVADMVAAGIGKDKARRFAKAAGLKGSDAAAWVRGNGALLGEISPEQQEALFNATYGSLEADVQRISDKPGVVKQYGETELETLTPAIKDTLVDLRYRGDYTGKAREKVQGAAANNDLLGMTDSLSDRSQWKGVPEDRFKHRSAYLKEAEREAEGRAYGWSNGPVGDADVSLTELQRLHKAEKARGGHEEKPEKVRKQAGGRGR